MAQRLPWRENLLDNSQIKKKAFSGAIWKFMERISAQMVSLVVSIVLARILVPEDYSVVSIVGIFFSFANVLITGGLNTALIQKKEADAQDYSSVLIVSTALSFVIYGILFFCAPLIAKLYDQPVLVLILRVMGLILPINAVKSIWCAYISSNLQFRKFFFSTIGGTVVSAIVGIVMALRGFGPWALVAQQMCNTVLGTLILIITTRISIRLSVSWQKLKQLLGYGWKVFASSVLGSIYTELNPLIIGLKFSGVDLAYYSKGRSFPTLISSTTNATLSAVLFPVLAKYQDDKASLLHGTRLFIRLTSFLVFPMMLGFLAVSDTFVRVVLTEKWLPAVPYIQIFCISSMFDMIHSGNCETIKAMGRSDIYLIMEVIKKTSYLFVIGLFVWLSDRPEMLAVSFVVCALVATFVNSVPNRKLIGYKFRYQCQDLLLNLGTSLLMCLVVVLAGKLPLPGAALLLIQVLIGITVYIALNLLVRNSSLTYLWNFVKGLLKGKKKC